MISQKYLESVTKKKCKEECNLNANNKTKQGRAAPFQKTGIERILVKNKAIQFSFPTVVALWFAFVSVLHWQFMLIYFVLCFLLTAELSLINTLAVFQRNRVVILHFSCRINASVIYCT